MKIFNPEKKLSKILNEEEKLNFHLDFIENKSILGIDIYKYSEYPEDVQVYVPVLFNSLYDITVANCCNFEKFFFQGYGVSTKEFKKNFISTGDGGFQIFDNPIQSLIFAAYFQLNVIRFNSDTLQSNLNKNLFDIIGRIELRYATTFEKVYCYDNNFFGPAIINNARILAKDNLNRFLIDFPTVKWFNQNINTIENLLIISKKDFLNIKHFKEYTDEKSLLFANGNGEQIKSIDVLKIGTIKSKNTQLEIFNLKIQFKLSITSNHKDYKNFLVTVGNLNTQGIE